MRGISQRAFALGPGRLGFITLLRSADGPLSTELLQILPYGAFEQPSVPVHWGSLGFATHTESVGWRVGPSIGVHTQVGGSPLIISPVDEGPAHMLPTGYPALPKLHGLQWPCHVSVCPTLTTR